MSSIETCPALSAFKGRETDMTVAISITSVSIQYFSMRCFSMRAMNLWCWVR